MPLFSSLCQRFSEALEAYAEAIDLDSTNMSFFSNRAAVYFEKKDYEGCISEVSYCIYYRGIFPQRPPVG